MNDFHVLVAGSREGLIESNVHQVLDQYKRFFDRKRPSDNLVIISGMAKGVDSHAVTWARKNNIDLIEKPANWNEYGKRAGYMRNKEMGELTNIALIFWDGVSISI